MVAPISALIGISASNLKPFCDERLPIQSRTSVSLRRFFANSVEKNNIHSCSLTPGQAAISSFTAHTLYSGVLLMGSSAALVRRLAAFSMK